MNNQMTTDELNRQVAERLGHPHIIFNWAEDYNAAHSLLEGMGEEEQFLFVGYLFRQVVPENNYYTEEQGLFRFLSATPAQLCEAWLKATEGRAGAGSRKEEAHG